jgi:lipopolysaccharide/colanic/teichoic acid biosynthesis glycosyltransferase
VKRGLELGLVLLSAWVWLPVLGVVAALIKLDAPGDPVFFVQQRAGKGGRPFCMYKFRTMVPDAEARKASLHALNELRWPDFKVTNDPRITRIGRWLRKSSLDELPQLLNVLRGEMALVGPRPTSFGASTYKTWQTERLDVAPGLTGLWQVARADRMLDFDERVRLEIAYARRCCLSLDLEILLRTVPTVLRGRGAY